MSAKTLPQAATEKLLAYQTLAEFNEGFTQILETLRKLKELGVLRGNLCTALQVAFEETRTWANFEATETLHDLEQTDWGRFGRLRRRWEKQYEDPHDVPIEAARQRDRPSSAQGRKGKRS